MKKRKSIHDLAKELQVSATTISFILNGKAEEKRISGELVERVLKYVQETGYQRNMIAQSLRTGKSMIIGMLVEDISDPFFSSISRIIEINAYKLGYKIFFSSTENENEKAKALIQIFKDRQVDGYIIAPTPGLEEGIKELLNDNHPVVLFDRYFPTLDTHNIIVDNYGGSYNVVHHFTENGFSNIGLVTLVSDQTQMADRLNGYIKAVSEKGYSTIVEKVPYNLDESVIKEIVKKFIQENTSLDAILFATNYLAVAGVKAISELGLKIPGDIAVAGFDDNTHFALFSPSITAVAQPVQEISEHIINRLMSLLSGESKKERPETEVLPVTLVVRESSLKKTAISKSKINNKKTLDRVLK